LEYRAIRANYVFGPFRLDVQGDTLFRGPEPVVLGHRAVALLRTLIDRAGVPVSKDTLIEAAWPGLAVEEGNLTVQIAALRRVLREEPGGERWIETLPRRGYRFVGPLIANAENSAVMERQTPAARDAPKLQAEAIGIKPLQAEPERRQLSIMSCELVWAGLDPEDMREAVRDYHACIANIAHTFQGFIAKHVGNTVLVYFGYPVALENDVEHAVRAGLALCTAVSDLKVSAEIPLRCRVGIATGLVIVGDSLCETEERGLIGEPPSVAARLQMLAQPSTVVIDEATHRLIGDLFDYRDVGIIEAGTGKPVLAWRVLGISTIGSRFEALRAAPLTPFVGRDEELELVLRRWAEAKRGLGRAVVLTGEPGIGKSRLMRAAQERLRTEPHTPLIYDCSPYHRDSALHPFISQLVRAAGIEREDTSDAKLDKLATLLMQSGELLDRDMALFAALLSIPCGDRFPLPNQTPRQLKENTFAALVTWLHRLCSRQPVLMLVEDLHWIDPTSLELLTRIVEQADGKRLMLLATARPEFGAPWPNHRHIASVALSRLDRSEGQALVAGISHRRTLPSLVLDQIVARADGVPLFIEELTKTVLESGLLRETTNGFELTGPLPPLAIPSTLRASLLARLDRFAVAVKGVAQVGAAIGREFHYALITPVAALPEVDLRDALSQLVNAELIFQRGVPPDATYVFKHALVQDAAYASLMKRRRHQLHGAIARTLEEGFPEIVETEPERVAHHLMEASLSNAADEHIGEQANQIPHHALHVKKAATYLRRAGFQAAARGANREAVAHLGQALMALRRLPEARETIELVFDTHIDLHFALSALGDWVRSGDHLHEAEVLARPLGDQLRLGQIATYMVMRCVITGNYDGAVRFGQEALNIARTRGVISIKVLATNYLGIAHLVRGEFRDAITLLEGNVVLEGDQRTERFGASAIPSVYSEATLADVLSELGRFDTAIEHAQAAVRIADTVDHPPTLYFGQFALGLAYLRRGDLPRATRVLQQSLDLSRKLEDVFRTSYVMATLGAAYALAGRAEEALPLIAEAVEVFRRREVHFRPALILLYAGMMYHSFGRIDEAANYAREALALTRRLGARANEAHALCLIGDIATTSGDNEAEEYYRQSMALAEARGMRPLVAHCHLGRGKLYRRTNKGEQAQVRLNLATKMYREMGMTYWQKRVEAELTESA
jgi:DNA-binding winged helix-turn-helix (wHTH) protein/tetratricopeptide (TPR) repeat protein